MAAAAAPVQLFAAQPLQGIDPIEKGGRLHLQQLKEDVFSTFNVDLTGDDPNTPHCRAVAEFHRRIVSATPALQKSLCLGLVYALLTEIARDAAWAGYWEYLAALRMCDRHHIAMRTLLGLARRVHALTEPAQDRVLVLLQDMALAQWEGVADLLILLQREVQVGDRRASSLRLLGRLIEISTKSFKGFRSEAPKVVGLTFLWAMRWLSFLPQGAVGSEGEEEMLKLRHQVLDLVKVLWTEARQPVLDLGQLLLWGLTCCRKEPGFDAVWNLVAEDDAAYGSAFEEDASVDDALKHLVSMDEEEQLSLLLLTEAGERNEARYFQWFVGRHLDNPAGRDAHLADIILWSSRKVSAAGPSRHSFWRRVWQFMSDASIPHQGQAYMAFAFAARWPGRSRDTFLSLLHGDRTSGPTMEQVTQLLRQTLLAPLATELSESLRSASGGMADDEGEDSQLEGDVAMSDT